MHWQGYFTHCTTLVFYANLLTSSQNKGNPMKLWQYITCLALGAICTGLSIGIILTSKSNMTLQDNIQARQQQLNNSVLGQQAQQVANSVLQDMAATAANDVKMRDLLAKNGFNVPAAPSASSTQKPDEHSQEGK
jgi:hypothetical protein